MKLVKAIGLILLSAAILYLAITEGIGRMTFP